MRPTDILDDKDRPYYEDKLAAYRRAVAPGHCDNECASARLYPALLPASHPASTTLKFSVLSPLDALMSSHKDDIQASTLNVVLRGHSRFVRSESASIVTAQINATGEW